MNMAFSQDFSKYNTFFEKVKEDVSRDIVFLDICKFSNTNSINSSLKFRIQCVKKLVNANELFLPQIDYNMSDGDTI